MKNFDKNLYRDTLEKHKVIIDTDPGVDDVACLLYAFFDKNIDIKLITSVVGNVFGLNIPVARGASKAMERESINAEFIHQAEGLGGYVPPTDTINKVIDEHAVEAMYKVLMAGDGDIVPIVLGPQTNIGYLLKYFPEVKKKIPKIVFMGGSPFGNPDYPDHISFNISSDPEAFKIVLDSQIPLVMIPSDVGRRKAHLTEEFVKNLANINDAGKLLYQMYSKYWEPGYEERRVATNDTLALFALVYPKMFTFKKVSVSVDLVETPGKTLVDFDGVGNVSIVTEIDREAFLQLLLSDLKEIKKPKN